MVEKIRLNHDAPRPAEADTGSAQMRDRPHCRSVVVVGLG